MQIFCEPISEYFRKAEIYLEHASDASELVNTNRRKVVTCGIEPTRACLSSGICLTSLQSEDSAIVYRIEVNACSTNYKTSNKIIS